MRKWRSETGAALLEAAFTIPMLLLVTVGIFEFGRAYQTWQVLTNAAREGARIAVLPDLTAPRRAAARARLHAGGAAVALRHRNRHRQPRRDPHRERRRRLGVAGQRSTIRSPSSSCSRWPGLISPSTTLGWLPSRCTPRP